MVSSAAAEHSVEPDERAMANDAARAQLIPGVRRTIEWREERGWTGYAPRTSTCCRS